MTSIATPATDVNHRLFRMTRLPGVALMTLLLLPEERERMTETFVCIGSSDVVRVTSNDHEPRIRNLHLVGPGFLDRMHLAAVRGDDERGRADALQDALFREIEL